MFYRARESQVAVHNIDNCQPNWSAMERPQSGGNTVMTVCLVASKYMYYYGSDQRHYSRVCANKNLGTSVGPAVEEPTP